MTQKPCPASPRDAAPPSQTERNGLGAGDGRAIMAGMSQPAPPHDLPDLPEIQAAVRELQVHVRAVHAAHDGVRVAMTAAVLPQVRRAMAAAGAAPAEGATPAAKRDKAAGLAEGIVAGLGLDLPYLRAAERHVAQLRAHVEALEAIFVQRLHRPTQVILFASFLKWGCDKNLADDLTVTATAQVWMKLLAFHRGDNYFAWVRAIGRNVLNTFYRNRDVERRKAREEMDRLRRQEKSRRAPAGPVDRETPLDALAGAETAAEVERLRGKLSGLADHLGEILPATADCAKELEAGLRQWYEGQSVDLSGSKRGPRTAEQRRYFAVANLADAARAALAELPGVAADLAGDAAPADAG